MIRDIATETQAYQAILEGHRAHPDDQAIADSLTKAKAAVAVAWLLHTSTTPVDSLAREMALAGVGSRRS
jgi:hypothetical protein